ncbi:MAG: hypothetical protein R3178_05160 [Rhodothermales bacterium]|nr:hypothetical protein [Rhodothermales bacterium]
MNLIRRALVGCVCLLAAACTSSAGEPSTTVTITIPVTTTTTTEPTTAGPTAPPTCDPPAFLPSALPERVVDDQPDVSAVPLDELTLQPGTIVTGWTDETGDPVVAFVRGALPPKRWVETPEPIEVRGTDAALGQLGDGIWAVAWFEGPDRCDEYYLVFYPPTGPDEARVVVESLTG